MHRTIIVWINNNNINSLFVYLFCKIHHFVFITTSHILVTYLQQEEDFLLYEIAIFSRIKTNMHRGSINVYA